MLPRVRNVSSSSYLCRPISTKAPSSFQSFRRAPLSREDAAIDKTFKSLVRIASNGDRLGGFAYTKKRNAEKSRLENALAAAYNRKGGYAPENIVFYEGQDNASTLEELSESLQSGPLAEPGSFVELRRDGIATQGVVLGSALNHGRMNLITLTTSGDILNHHATDVMFVIPGFVEPDLVTRCGLDELSPSQHTTAARLSVLKRAKDFERAAEAASNGVAQNIHSLYSKVASPDPEAWGEVSTVEAARILGRRAEVPILRLFAVHKQLMHRHEEFIAHPSAHQHRHVFTVRPLAHVENIRNVRRWIWERNSPFPGFVEKARGLVEHARRTVRTNCGDLPAKQDDVPVLFSNAELQIIKFLQRYLRNIRIIQADPYATAIPSIVKAIDPTQGDIDFEVVQNLLTEIGVYAPWQDIIFEHSRLYKNDPAPSSSVVQHDSKAKDVIADAGSLVNQYLPSSDPHLSIRHDFGNLPVYVVDDATAEELDDGISFEPVPGEPDSSWIHVHVADPTALIPFDSEVARRARKQMSSFYLIHNSWPLLPPSLEIPDLNTKRMKEGEGRNVLTFSCKVDKDGNISDSTARAGIVRNVHKMTYDDVDVLLGLDPERTLTYPFEPPSQGVVASSRELSHLQEHDSNLRQLYSISQNLVRNRNMQSILLFSRPAVEISMTPRPPPSHSPYSNKPTFYTGFPSLRYAVVDTIRSDTGARSMVSEFMKAACRTASIFCTAHGLPAVRRAGEPWQFPSEAVLEDLLSQRNENGYVDALALTKAGYIARASRYTLEPAGHWMTGVKDGEGYVRATSPLRRFSDMVVHWQIKAALSRERPPFSTEDTLVLMKEMEQFDSEDKRVQRTHQRYWALMFIRRYMEQRSNGSSLQAVHDDPLRNLEAYVMQETSKNAIINMYQTDVFIPSLGLTAELQTEKNRGFVNGETITVKVNDVRLGLSPRFTVELA